MFMANDTKYIIHSISGKLFYENPHFLFDLLSICSLRKKWSGVLFNRLLPLSKVHKPGLVMRLAIQTKNDCLNKGEAGELLRASILLWSVDVGRRQCFFLVFR